MSHDEYLRSLFTALEAKQPAESVGLSHGIAYEDGALYALVGMGDVRAKIRVQELDPDPIRMADAIIGLWRSCPTENLLFDERP
jgi:hypothetical protein